MKSIILLFVGIIAMIIPASQLVSAQLLFPIQYSEVPNTAMPQGLDPRYMTFEQFMQFMALYKDFFGQDIDVKKVYKEYHDDDDDDNDDDHDHKDRDHDKKPWWKHKDPDRDNKKKYCEGKGHWNGKKCVTDNEEDEAAHEDAVCDRGSDSKFCKGGDDEEDEEDENDEEDNTRDSEEEEEESEPSEDSDSSDEGDSDDDEGSDDSDDSDSGDDGGDGGDSGDSGGDGDGN